MNTLKRKLTIGLVTLLSLGSICFAQNTASSSNANEVTLATALEASKKAKANNFVFRDLYIGQPIAHANLIWRYKCGDATKEVVPATIDKNGNVVSFDFSEHGVKILFGLENTSPEGFMRMFEESYKVDFMPLDVSLDDPNKNADLFSQAFADAAGAQSYEIKELFECNTGNGTLIRIEISTTETTSNFGSSRKKTWSMSVKKTASKKNFD